MIGAGRSGAKDGLGTGRESVGEARRVFGKAPEAVGAFPVGIPFHPYPLTMMMPLAFFGSSMGAGEILLILLVMLLLFGADRLPAMARSLGKLLEDVSRAARDLTHDLMDSQQPPPASGTKPPLPPPSEPPSDERKG